MAMEIRDIIEILATLGANLNDRSDQSETVRAAATKAEEHIKDAWNLLHQAVNNSEPRPS